MSGFGRWLSEWNRLSRNLRSMDRRLIRRSRGTPSSFSSSTSSSSSSSEFMGFLLLFVFGTLTSTYVSLPSIFREQLLVRFSSCEVLNFE